MTDLAQFRDTSTALKLLDDIRSILGGRHLRVMEVCGTHTVALFRTGLRTALQDLGVEFISGPGCPVCVTTIGITDTAIRMAQTPGVEVVTFGDMMRVPGSLGSLATAKAEGASVRIIYSPHEMLTLAQEKPEHYFVFLGVGFETTLPTIASMLDSAQKRGLKNTLLLPAGKVVPPALRALFNGGARNIDALLLPGHVATVLGADAFGFVADELHLPAAIAGFESVDILLALRELVRCQAEGMVQVINAYPRAVTASGNTLAQKLMNSVFHPSTAEWRGLGQVKDSGMMLAEDWQQYDALSVLNIQMSQSPEPEGCLCGSVLLGEAQPTDCPLFGGRCTPETAVGACMVSSEGSCAAWYKYG